MTRRARIRAKHHNGSSIRVDRPQPGYFKTKRGGVWVPALVYESPARDPITGAAMDRAPSLLCVINGTEESVWDVWTSLHPIERSAYERLCREREGVAADANMMTSKVRI